MSARKFNVEEMERRGRQVGFETEALAVLYGLSPRQLLRRFREDFGTTPTDWLRRLRCRLCVELIAQGYSTKALVAEFNFSNSAHVCHEFQKVYQASPQSFAPLRRNVGNEQ